MGLFGDDNYNSRHASYGQTVGKPEEEQRREMFFYRGKKWVGGWVEGCESGFYKHSPLEKTGSSKCSAFHWQSYEKG